MKQQKHSIQFLIESVFLIVFIILFFMFEGIDNPASVWTAFIFLVVAYLSLFLTKMIDDGSDNYILGLSRYGVSGIYFIAQFIVTILILLTEPESVKISIAIQLVLLATYIVAFSSVVRANIVSAEKDMVRKQEINFIKGTANRINYLMNLIDDKEIKKELESLYAIVHSSPTKSTNENKEIERNIENELNDLEMDIEKEDVNQIKNRIKRIHDLIIKRNSCV